MEKKKLVVVYNEYYINVNILLKFYITGWQLQLCVWGINLVCFVNKIPKSTKLCNLIVITQKDILKSPYKFIFFVNLLNYILIYI